MYRNVLAWCRLPESLLIPGKVTDGESHKMNKVKEELCTTAIRLFETEFYPATLSDKRKVQQLENILHSEFVRLTEPHRKKKSPVDWINLIWSDFKHFHLPRLIETAIKKEEVHLESSYLASHRPQRTDSDHSKSKEEVLKELVTSVTPDYTPLTDEERRYDAEGNRSKKSTGTNITTYSWDQRDRLTGATTKTSGTTNKLVTVVYDAFNRRIAEYAGNGTTVTRRDRYFWDGEEVHTIANGTTTPTVTDRFLMGPGIDNTIADEKAGTVNWTLTDIRGSVQQVLDSTGKSVTSKDYSTFGVKTDTGNPSVTDTVFAYTGREYDPDLGLQYNRNRWYDPSTQRFMSADPAQADANTYRYANNDSVNKIDPTGLDHVEIGNVLTQC